MPPGTAETLHQHAKSRQFFFVLLKIGRVAAAGLDVYEREPKLNPGYIGLKNTFLLPHIGWATIESRTNMGMVALYNIYAVLNGKPGPSLAEV
jgi:lactate dehydrogenase-like 2-hydroxyacid dehydrogenase